MLQKMCTHLLVVEPNIPNLEILFNCIVTLEYCTFVPPTLGFEEVPRKRGFKGNTPEKFVWDMCWPIVLTHGIELTLEFSHCISPIKESIEKRLSMVLYCIGRTVRA